MPQEPYRVDKLHHLRVASLHKNDGRALDLRRKRHSGSFAELLDGSARLPDAPRDERWNEHELLRRTAAEIDPDPGREALGLPRRLQDLAGRVREVGAPHLASDDASRRWNGLTVQENRRLFRSRDPVEIASTVLRGLLAVNRRKGAGHFEIELVRGDVQGADHLDVLSLAAFDDVPLGGAGAAVDQVIGGRASRSHATGEALVAIESDGLDADWLFLASLGPLRTVDALGETVRQAAIETAWVAERHGFHRVGLVTFGGTVTDRLEHLVSAMLTGLESLRGRATLVWFETNASRFDALHATLRHRPDVRVTTRRFDVDIVGRPCPPR